MKKKIIIISVVLIGFFLAVTANSWAQRERGGDRRVDRGDRGRGGQFQKLDKPAVHKFNRNSGRAYQPRRNPHHYRPVHRFKPKYRYWHHRPAYRHAPIKRYFRRHRHSVINQVTNYYSSAESDAAPQDEFQASASVSDSGFSVSVGVSKTN